MTDGTLLSCLKECIDLTFPKGHTVSLAFSNYTKKGAPTLEADCLALYSKHKESIFKGDKWLVENSIILGTKKSGVYLSLLYYKSRDARILEAYRDYIRAHIGDSDESSTSESDESSTSESEPDESVMEAVRGVYASVRPELLSVIQRMNVPPPDGVRLSDNTIRLKESDIRAVQSGIETFETMSGFKK